MLSAAPSRNPGPHREESVVQEKGRSEHSQTGRTSQHEGPNAVINVETPSFWVAPEGPLHRKVRKPPHKTTFSPAVSHAYLAEKPRYTPPLHARSDCAYSKRRVDVEENDGRCFTEDQHHGHALRKARDTSCDLFKFKSFDASRSDTFEESGETAHFSQLDLLDDARNEINFLSPQQLMHLGIMNATCEESDKAKYNDGNTSPGEENNAIIVCSIYEENAQDAGGHKEHYAAPGLDCSSVARNQNTKSYNGATKISRDGNTLKAKNHNCNSEGHLQDVKMEDLDVPMIFWNKLEKIEQESAFCAQSSWHNVNDVIDMYVNIVQDPDEVIDDLGQKHQSLRHEVDYVSRQTDMASNLGLKVDGQIRGPGIDLISDHQQKEDVHSFQEDKKKKAINAALHIPPDLLAIMENVNPTLRARWLNFHKQQPSNTLNANGLGSRDQQLPKSVQVLVDITPCHTEPSEMVSSDTHCSLSKVQTSPRANENSGSCALNPPDSQAYLRHSKSLPGHINGKAGQFEFHNTASSKRLYPILPKKHMAPYVLCQHCNKLLAVPDQVGAMTSSGIQKIRCSECLKVSKFSLHLDDIKGSDSTQNLVHPASASQKCQMPPLGLLPQFNQSGIVLNGHTEISAGVTDSHPVKTNIRELNTSEAASMKGNNASNSGNIEKAKDDLEAYVLMSPELASLRLSEQLAKDEENFRLAYSIRDRTKTMERPVDAVMGMSLEGTFRSMPAPCQNVSLFEHFVYDSEGFGIHLQKASILAALGTPLCSPLLKGPWQDSSPVDESLYFGRPQPSTYSSAPPLAPKGLKFIVSLLNKSLSELVRTNRQKINAHGQVIVNGQILPNAVVRQAENKAGPVHFGSYWYDPKAGFWGVKGGPCLGMIPPCIEEFTIPMAKDCAGGNTQVEVNGRELHVVDLQVLARRGLPTTPGKCYFLNILGHVVDATSGEVLKCLGKLAPTVERKGHGYGMFQTWEAMLQNDNNVVASAHRRNAHRRKPKEVARRGDATK